jgi:hypothetical protein
MAMRAEFEAYYLRQLTHADFKKRLAINVDCGFLGMFVSLDHMHYEWKNYHVKW